MCNISTYMSTFGTRMLRLLKVLFLHLGWHCLLMAIWISVLYQTFSVLLFMNGDDIISCMLAALAATESSTCGRGKMSHSTQNRSFFSQPSQLVSWLMLRKGMVVRFFWYWSLIEDSFFSGCGHRYCRMLCACCRRLHRSLKVLRWEQIHSCSNISDWSGPQSDIMWPTFWHCLFADWFLPCETRSSCVIGCELVLPAMWPKFICSRHSEFSRVICPSSLLWSVVNV